MTAIKYIFATLAGIAAVFIAYNICISADLSLFVSIMLSLFAGILSFLLLKPSSKKSEYIGGWFSGRSYWGGDSGFFGGFDGGGDGGGD